MQIICQKLKKIKLNIFPSQKAYTNARGTLEVLKTSGGGLPI